ncbi:trichohyalin-like [Sebastes umbrosus]|uniref:trichohyalin-like n=1 Tax=Sebastes umbrosus TaxID=72105 RepID=UPI0018A0055D|nr:trichohyalin-like [Sebastes umbrosus]
MKITSSRMLHVTDRPSCVAFTVLVVLALIHSCRGQSEVIGPSQPIVATLGDDVVLPCRLEPVQNAVDMTVEWARPDLDPRFVHVGRRGKELERMKHPSYRGRTSLSTEGLMLGDVSLKLSRVEISDQGTYRCYIPDLYRGLTVQLLVGAVSSPVIQTSQSGDGGGVLLQCESEGWYPEPEVLWLDGEGDVLSAGPTETLRRPDDLYTVSSRLTVDQRPSSNFTCRVQQKSINQTRETRVHVPDHFFMVPSTPSTPSTPDAPSTPSTSSTSSTPSTPGVIIGSVIAALLFIAAVLFVVWKWRQKKSKPQTRSPEDGPDQTDEEKTVSSKSDNTGSQVVMEGEGEREPLMAGREEENNVDDRGEEGERKDETHHGELVTEPDVDGADRGRGIKSIKQDVAGRQVKNDGDEDGGEQTVKPVEEDSGLPLVLVEEGLEESNVHQEVQKEEVTRQDPMNDVDKKEAKEENEQKEVSSGRTGQKKKKKKNWREQMQPEVGRRSVELQSKTQKRKDEMKLKQQKGGVLEDRKQEGSEAEHREKIEKHQEGNQSDRTMTKGREAENQKETEEKRELQKQEVEARDLRTQEGALDTNRQEAEHLDEEGKHQEGNQSDRTMTTGRKAENQKELINVKPKETEEKRQDVEARERDKDLRTQEGASDARRQEAEHLDEKGKHQEGNQSDRMTTMTGRKAENQKELINETVKETEDERQEEIKKDGEKIELKTQEGDGSKDQEGNQRDFTRKVQINEKSKETEREKKPPSAGREETRKRPDLRRHQETAGREHQELQQEEESEKSPEGTKKQPERCSVGKERREDGTDEGPDVDENQQKSEEMRRRGQQQQQEDVIEEVRQQPEESSQRLTDGGVKSEEDHQDEPMKCEIS